MPAPLAMPPTVQPSRVGARACLATVSVVMIALGGVGAAVGGQGGGGGVDAGEQLVHRQQLADQAGGADHDVAGARSPSASATCSAVAWVSGKPCGAGAGVGAAGVEHDGVDPAVGDDLARTTCTGCGLDAVGREDGGGAGGRARR